MTFFSNLYCLSPFGAVSPVDHDDDDEYHNDDGMRVFFSSLYTLRTVQVSVVTTNEWVSRSWLWWKIVFIVLFHGCRPLSWLCSGTSEPIGGSHASDHFFILILNRFYLLIYLFIIFFHSLNMFEACSARSMMKRVWFIDTIGISVDHFYFGIFCFFLFIEFFHFIWPNHDQTLK